MNALRHWRTALPLAVFAALAALFATAVLFPHAFTGDPLPGWPTFSAPEHAFSVRFPGRPVQRRETEETYGTLRDAHTFEYQTPRAAPTPSG